MFAFSGQSDERKEQTGSALERESSQHLAGTGVPFNWEPWDGWFLSGKVAESRGGQTSPRTETFLYDKPISGTRRPSYGS